VNAELILRKKKRQRWAEAAADQLIKVWDITRSLADWRASIEPSTQHKRRGSRPCNSRRTLIRE
jgi:hypothetical protein